MNLPNKLTLMRLIFVPVIMVFILFQIAGDPWSDIVAATLFLAAAITDMLDGRLARRYDLVTDFGKLMDPLADKIFIVATFVMMADYGIIPAWIVVVVLSREFMVTGLRLLTVSEGVVIAADKSGKFKTAFQMVSLIVAGAGWVKLFGFNIFEPTIWKIWYAIMLLVVFFTLYSGISYFVKNYKLIVNKL